MPCSIFLHQYKWDFHLPVLWQCKNDAAAVHTEVVDMIFILRTVQKENIKRK